MAGPVVGEGVRLGRIGHHEVTAADLGEPSIEERVAGAALPHREIAAGVEDKDVGAVGPVQLAHHVVDSHRLVFEVELVLKLGIDRHDVVAAFVLQAVARIIGQGRLRALRRTREMPEVLANRVPSEIDAAEHLETGVLERVRHVPRIVLRIRESREAGVLRVADHERDASAGRSGDSQFRGQRQGDAQQDDQQCAHAPWAQGYTNLNIYALRLSMQSDLRSR